MSMVTIVVALASKAKYTFLDEPTAGLDVVARNDFYKLLIEEYTESGRTFVISTHIIDEASDVFEEVIIIKDKKIALKENTTELLERALFMLEIMRYPVPAVYPSCRKRISHFSCAGGHIR